MPSAKQEGGVVHIESDGPHGRHGSREPRASAGGYNGADGQDGAHARPPSPGIDAGRVELTLRCDDQAVHVDGSSSHAGRAQSVRTHIPLSVVDELVLHAKGGIGGDGGHGGAGGAGARGRRGNDATRYSSGTNGGRGGDGGDGGKGTHGAPGGDGGHIVVRVDDKDTYALMAIADAEHPAPLVAGGKGGTRGKHGEGGSGGAGGPGGSSYSWTESHTTTDSDGNSRTHTTFHSNPGGSRGPSGARGYTPNSPLVHGRDGENGSFTIAVQSPTGEHHYARRYDLNLRAFDIDEPDDLDDDGILEFGERIRTKNFHYENVGGMPTPRHQRIRLQLQAGDLVIPREEEQFIAKSLKPNEETVVPDALHFDVKDPVIDAPGDPLVWREEVYPQAWQLGHEVTQSRGVDSLFQRRFDNVLYGRTIVARFPLRNTEGTRILRSLAPGEGTRLEFTFENISKVSLGGDAARKRPVAIHLWLAPDAQVRPDQVHFVDESGTRFPFAPPGDEFVDDSTKGGQVRSGWVCEIPVLQAQSSGHVRGALWIAADVEPWSAVTLRFSLLLARLDRTTTPGADLRTVQQREFTVRAEPGYDWNAGNRVMLVAHDEVTREAWRAWHRVLEDDFGLGTDDWSLTRYGHVDFDADPGDGTSLRAHLQDRLVVVLNHPFHPTGDENTQLPTDYVQARDVRTAVVAEGTHALVVGDPRFELDQWLAPVRDVRAGGVDANDLSDLVKKEKTAADRLVQEEFREDPTIAWDNAKVLKKTFYFFTPDQDAMRKRTAKFLKRLEEIHPNRRYVIVEKPHDVPKKVGHSWWFGLPIYELGSVEVRRTLDDDRAFSVVQPANAQQVDSAAFIESAKNRFAIALALPFSEKLASLDRVLNRGTVASDLDEHQFATAQCLVRAILIDLIEEQEALQKRRARLTDDVLERNLVALERLVKAPLRTAFGAKSNRYLPLIDLWAGLSAYLESHNRWWRLFGRKRKIRAHTEDKLEQFAMRAFNEGAIDDAGGTTMESETARAEMEKRREVLLGLVDSYRETIDPKTERARKDAAAGFLFRQYLRDGDVTRDMDVFQNANARLWSESDLLRAQAREKRREDAQQALRARNAAERTALLLAPHAKGRAVVAGEWSTQQRQEIAEEAEAVVGA